MILAVIAVVLTGVMLLIAHFAPLGWEDANGFHTGTPSPCERDAQDGRGEGGEGARAFHSQPIKTILEQDHA